MPTPVANGMARIAVLVKAAIDVNLIRTDQEGRVLVDKSPLAISEYDRNAVQAALDIKSKLGGQVAALSLATWGPVGLKKKEYENVMREVLAMGVDEAHVVLDDEYASGTPLNTAEALAALARRLDGFDVYVTGEGSSDMVSSQLAPRLGALLGIPAVSFVKKIEFEGGYFKFTRDLEDKLEAVKTSAPVVISVTGEVNQPRLPTLLQIRRAFAKPIKYYSASELEVGRKPVITEVSIKMLTQRRKNTMIDASKPEEAAELLVQKLTEEGVVVPRG